MSQRPDRGSIPLALEAVIACENTPTSLPLLTPEYPAEVRQLLHLQPG